MDIACIDRACSTPRWHWFAYVTGRDDRALFPHHARDAAAALALQPALAARGFSYGGPIFNYPAPQPPPKVPIEVDDYFLRPGDLVVLTTRPPLDDWADGVRSHIRRSYTTLESKAFRCAEGYLEICSGARVCVADPHARASPEVARLANIQFRQNRNAAIDAVMAYGSGRWQRPRRAEPTTMTYLIYEPQAWANGPGLLVSFGMSGLDTLIWNELLAKKYPDLVATVPFVMAEMPVADLATPPHDLRFLHDWKVRLVIPHASKSQ